MVFKGYKICLAPIGFRNNAPTDKINDSASIWRCRGAQRDETSEPERKSKKKPRRNIPAIANPKKKDPWQFTQSANSGGRQKNQRGLRLSPRCTTNNSTTRKR